MDVVQRSVIFYYRFKGRGDKRIHTKLVAAYGRDAHTIDSVKYWVREHDDGRRDPPDSAKAGRPPSDISEAVAKVLNEEPFSSTKHIAAQLRTSRELVKRTLIDVLGMKKFSLRWVPHTLTGAQKRDRVADSRRLLTALRADAANGFVNIITADESWYYWSYSHSSQWSTSRDLVPTRPIKKIDSKKSMFTLLFSGYGLLVLDSLPKGCKMNSQYFCDVVLGEAKRAVTTIAGESGIELMKIHMDNCKVHNSAKTTERLDEFQITRLPHPAYSRDISPCDFWFFGWTKNELQGKQFQGPDEVRIFLSDLWRDLEQNTLISVYHEWIARLEQVILMNGEYYSK
jgi:hypothetical protein